MLSSVITYKLWARKVFNQPKRISTRLEPTDRPPSPLPSIYSDRLTDTRQTVHINVFILIDSTHVSDTKFINRRRASTDQNAKYATHVRPTTTVSTSIPFNLFFSPGLESMRAVSFHTVNYI